MARNEERGLAPQSLVQVECQVGAASVFDEHHPPEKRLVDECVHCGFCLPACPTYQLWGEEMDSPRGRIWLMRKGIEGTVALDTTFQLHMDRCLGCMACMTACPSGVKYGKLIEDTRGQVERHVPRGWWDRAFRRMLFATFPFPARLRLLALPMLVYQRLGVQRLVRGSGVLRLLPKRLQAMEALLPRVPATMFSKTAAVQATGKRRGRVGMLTGCVQEVFFGRVNRATARVLAAEGFEVVVPPAQGCCGALMVHSGLADEAAVMARKLIAAFEECETVVINAAGCGSTMKEYGHLLRDDPAWAARAAAFSAKCKDVSEVLAGIEPRAPRHPLQMRVAYQDACHLRHAQGIWEQPRGLLAGIPGLVIEEMEEATLCCGSAGVYNLLQPEAANELGDRKVERLLETGAEAVVSANPGCLLQLMSGLRRRGLADMPAFHTVELLDASIRGMGKDEMRSGRQTG